MPSVKEVPMQPNPSEFVIHAGRAFHGPTGSEIWLKFLEQNGPDYDAMIQPGVLGGYDRDEVMRMAAVHLYRDHRYWKCPICEQVVDRKDPQRVQKAYDSCELQEHYGAECIAHHEPTKARDLLAIKVRRG